MLIDILVWIVLISAFSVFGAWYVRKFQKPDAIIGIYVAFILISNIVAFKIVEYDLGFISVTAPAAVIIFAVTFLLIDVVNEKFGRKETQRMIFIAFISQIAAAVFIFLAIDLPPASFFADNVAFIKVLAFAPRIMVASWAAFLVSENADAWIYAWFKKKTKGKQLWARNVFSGLPSMVLDSMIFVGIAFYGIAPVIPLIFGQIVIKWLVGIIDIPFMYISRAVLYSKD